VAQRQINAAEAARKALIRLDRLTEDTAWSHLVALAAETIEGVAGSMARTQHEQEMAERIIEGLRQQMDHHEQMEGAQ
jgi:hypothetical protein